MDPIEFLRILRRRILVVVLAIGIAVVPAVLTSSGGPLRVAPPVSSFEAKVVMLSSGNTGGFQSATTEITKLGTVAALATIGDVPRRAARSLNFKGDPLVLAARVEARAQEEKGIIEITARSRDSKEAVTTADAFARELLGFLSDRKREAAATQIESLTRRLAEIKGEIGEAESRVGSAEGAGLDIAKAERDAKIRQYGFLYETYQRLSESAGQPASLQIVQAASARPVTQGGFQPPRTRNSRMLLAIIVGLFLGIGIALLLERADTKIRSRKQAEEVFGLPVLAEVPSMSRRERSPEPGRSRAPSRSADAFRLLASGLLGPAGDNGNGDGPAHPQAILVTSAGPGEGKTTVTANLATTYAEFGRRVLILSCDFRSGRIHRVFGVSNEGGLAAALSSTTGDGTLSDYVRGTAFSEISLVPSGSSPSAPGELLTSWNMHRALEEARGIADVVLLDSAPILMSDATHLIPQVDAVVVVARAGVTTIEMAERSRELLARLGAPVVGLVLNETDEIALPRGSYARRKFARV